MEAVARTGTHNPRTVYLEYPDGRSLFLAVAMSDRTAVAIADAINTRGEDPAVFRDCPPARRSGDGQRDVHP
jgi:hypothetical protein